MAPCAYIVHQIRGRVRLRIKDKRNDYPYFEAVRRELDLIPGVEEIRINPATGTILLLYAEQSDTRLQHKLRQLDLFEIIEGPEPATPVLAPLAQGISMIDQTLLDSSGGRVDLRAVTYIGLMAITVHQIRRGQLLGPALPLIGQAFSLLNRINGWRDAATADANDESDAFTFSGEDG